MGKMEKIKKCRYWTGTECIKGFIVANCQMVGLMCYREAIKDDVLFKGEGSCG